MAARPHFFELRLSDAELADLEKRAERQGRTKADVIRGALGWERERRSRNVNRMAGSIARGAVDGRSINSQKEPGRAAIARLGRHIRRRAGD